MTWTPTREAALERLEFFAPHTGERYARGRNYDRTGTGRDSTSQLSPWLTRRVITEEEVARAALAHHGLEEAEKFLQEVCWRTYFKGWLEQRPHVWTQFTQRVERLVPEWAEDERYQVAMAGETGIDCFDDWARALVRTGWLHNHTRMWFASIWLFTLKLPWELGADFFARHLIDFDAASNTLSWRWVAGLHTRGKTYLARPDNIARYTEGRYQPKGLATDAEPVDETIEVGDRAALPQDEPMPAGAFCWLVHEEECAPETYPGFHPDAAPLIGVVFRPEGTTTAAMYRFDQRCVSNALERHDVDENPAGATASHLHAAIADEIMDRDNFHYVLYRVPVGPARDAWLPIRAELERAGIRVTERVRPWDSAFWPHARAGFFGLKKQIPTVFQELGLI